MCPKRQKPSGAAAKHKWLLAVLECGTSISNFSLHGQEVGMNHRYFLRQSVMHVLDAGAGCFCNFNLPLPCIYDLFAFRTTTIIIGAVTVADSSDNSYRPDYDQEEAASIGSVYDS